MTNQTSHMLSRNEWAAVSIALQDAQRCGCATAQTARPGLFNRVMKFVFGQRRPTPLADPRLEAVRSFVCASYRRRDTARDLAPSLAAFGFSPAQIDALGQLSR